MDVSSLLFRQATAELAHPTRVRSLRQMLKPWPQTAPPQPAPRAAPPEEDAAWLSGEIASVVVRDRLAKFTRRES